MIELRWLNRMVDQKSTRVLQYRQQEDITIRAGMWNNADIARTATMQMSSWRDVPEVFEQTVNTTVSKCTKCGIVLEGSMSYVCPQVNCPTGLGSSIS